MARKKLLAPEESKHLMRRHEAALATLDDFEPHERWKALALVLAPPPEVLERQRHEQT